MDHIALAVAGDLHLDMPAALDQFLDDQAGIAKGVLGLPHRGFDLAGKTIEVRDRAHALAAAAGRGLQHDRRLEVAHDAVDFGRILAGRLAAGNDRHLGGFGFQLGGGLVAEPLDHLRRSAR